jgi:hypothetical protein
MRKTASQIADEVLEKCAISGELAQKVFLEKVWGRIMGSAAEGRSSIPKVMRNIRRDIVKHPRTYQHFEGKPGAFSAVMGPEAAETVKQLRRLVDIPVSKAEIPNLLQRLERA